MCSGGGDSEGIKRAKRRLGVRRDAQALPFQDASLRQLATPRNGETRNSHADSRTRGNAYTDADSHCHHVDALIAFPLTDTLECFCVTCCCMLFDRRSHGSTAGMGLSNLDGGGCHIMYVLATRDVHRHFEGRELKWEKGHFP